MKRLQIFFLLSLLISSINSGNLRATEQEDYTMGNLIIFMKFQDEPEFINDVYSGITVREYTENSYQRSEYSLRSYYESASGGKVKIKTFFLFDEQGNSITLPKRRGYFAKYDEHTNQIGYTNEGEKKLRVTELENLWATEVSKLVQKVKPKNFDKTVTYTYKDLDKNGDGKIDAISVIYKETVDTGLSVEWASPLWVYQSYNSQINVSENGRTISSYKYLQITNQGNYLYKDKDGLIIMPLSTIVHEYGHILGLLDLYNSRSESKIYFMSAMGKHTSPFAQYITAKEREDLGWLNENHVKNITKIGKYTVNLSTDKLNDEVIAYKAGLRTIEKDLYIEYRRFDSNLNRFDTQKKNILNLSKDGEKLTGITLKSGLLVFLVSKDTKFPSNMNSYGNNWNYEVLGGEYQTRSDAGLQKGESVDITSDLHVEVIEMTDKTITFELTGEEFTKTIPKPTDPSLVKGIKLINPPRLLSPGDHYSFNVQLDAPSTVPKEIDWEVTANASPLTKISSGVLMIADGESANGIIVRAYYRNNYGVTTFTRVNIDHTKKTHDHVVGGENMEHIKETKSTCSTEGTIEHYRCKICGKNFNKLAPGGKYKSILTDSDVRTPKAPHTEVIESTSVEPTCTQEGRTNRVICSVCNQVVEEPHTISKLPHQESDWITDKAPTKTEAGHKYTKCEVCGTIIQEKVIPPSGGISQNPSQGNGNSSGSSGNSGNSNGSNGNSGNNGNSNGSSGNSGNSNENNGNSSGSSENTTNNKSDSTNESNKGSSSSSSNNSVKKNNSSSYIGSFITVINLIFILTIL